MTTEDRRALGRVLLYLSVHPITLTRFLWELGGFLKEYAMKKTSLSLAEAKEQVAKLKVETPPEAVKQGLRLCDPPERGWVQELPHDAA